MKEDHIPPGAVAAAVAYLALIASCYGLARLVVALIGWLERLGL